MSEIKRLTVKEFNKILASGKVSDVSVSIPPRREYEEKLVAYFDILGVTDLVREKEDDAEFVLTLMEDILKYVDDECHVLQKKGDLDFLQLGDGFIIVSPLKCINSLCEILSSVQWQVLVYKQMLLRGAITAGKVSTGKNSRIIIGPAFLEAFSLENENAIYPRIIYDDRIINKCLTNNSIDLNFGYIDEDNDKLKYLDFIKYIVKTEKYSTEKLDQLLAQYDVKDWLKKGHEKYIKNRTDVAQKYGWLISRFSSHGIKII